MNQAQIIETIMAGVISLLNVIVLFALGRATAAMDRLYDKIDGKDGIERRLTTLEARVHSCPTCRESTER